MTGGQCSPGEVVARCLLLLAVLLCGTVSTAQRAPASLDRGFNLLYNIDFGGAQQEFAAWEREHPGDPIGPVCEAAGLLFAELHRLGVLEAQFFLKDSSFESKRQLSPDAAVRTGFESALGRSEGLAQNRIAKNANDVDALFAMTLAGGLRADYSALIEKRNLQSLRYTRQAGMWAEKLLAIRPDYYDAYLATGIGKYIIGSLAAPVRWFLRLGGYSGDKAAGLRELELTAQRGRFLGPFARLLLAVAYLRQKDKPRARELLAGLRDQFPGNPLYAREIARLDGAVR